MYMVYDKVRIFSTEDVYNTDVYYTNFQFSLTNMSPRLVPSPDTRYINLATSTCFHPFL